jgi:hypothetical protein
MILGRFFLWLAGDDCRLVKVKAWSFCFGPYGLEGPCMLVDDRYGRRQTISPVWDMDWLRARFQRN